MIIWIDAKKKSKQNKEKLLTNIASSDVEFLYNLRIERDFLNLIKYIY